MTGSADDGPCCYCDDCECGVGSAPAHPTDGVDGWHCWTTEAVAVLAALERRQADAEDAYAADVLARTTTTGLTIEGGMAVVDVRPPHELVVAMAAAMAESLGSAPNYAETPISFETKAAGSAETFILTVQRKLGRTPHELRQDAERERDKLRAEVGALKEKLNIVALIGQQREMQRDEALAALATIAGHLGVEPDPSPHGVAETLLSIRSAIADLTQEAGWAKQNEQIGDRWLADARAEIDLLSTQLTAARAEAYTVADMEADGDDS